MGLATMASGPLFGQFGSRGHLLMGVMSAAGLAGAVQLYSQTRLDPA